MNSSNINLIQLEGPSKFDHSVISKIVHENMDDPGYVVLRGLDMGADDLNDASNFLLKLANHLGRPVSHDENGSFIWDIRATEPTNSKITTFSQHSDEAFLHTDSQYRECPEDIFGLYCLTPAADGSGLSLILTYRDFMHELMATPERMAMIPLLRNTQYPFAVPTVFKHDVSGPDEYVFSPILEDGDKLRFRVDTLYSAITSGVGDLSYEALKAFEMVKKILEKSKKVKSLLLKQGDLLFVNNRQTLHGRTGFTDPKRHLLRVRVSYNDA